MDDDFLSLMDDSGEQREDLKCPEGEIGEQIRAAIDGEQDIMVRNRSRFTIDVLHISLLYNHNGKTITITFLNRK